MLKITKKEGWWEEFLKAGRGIPTFAVVSRSILFCLPVLFPVLFIACPGNGGQNGSTNQYSSVAPTVAPSVVGSSPSPETQTQLSAFDANRAMENVRKQVEMGPRPAGSSTLAKTRDFIAGELRSYGLNVSFDEFHPKTPQGDRKMVNITAELPGESSDVVMLASHYDTKLFKKFKFVGANDAGSSTGTLMEMARVLAANKQKPTLTYWFVFFDGEEAFCTEWEQCQNPDGPDNTYGSRHFVAELQKKNNLQKVRAMILLDMMGYRDLELGRDDISTPWLVDAVWQTAKQTGHSKQFVDRPEGVGGDDHLPFLRAGIDSLDIIQLSTYPYWHTEEDTLDKVSPESLKAVGDVLLSSFSRIEQHLSAKK